MLDKVKLIFWAVLLITFLAYFFTVGEGVGNNPDLSLPDYREGSGSVYKIDKDKSLIQFRVAENIYGEDITVLGESKEIFGSFYLDVNDFSSFSSSVLMIDAKSFKTDIAARDAAISNVILGAIRPENAYVTFSIKEVKGTLEQALVVGDRVLLWRSWES